MAHKCPSPDCPTSVPDHMLACKKHWFQLPKNIRDDIWEGYRSKNTPDGFDLYCRAVTDAHDFWEKNK